MAFRHELVQFLRGYASIFRRGAASPGKRINVIGKAKPFRTSRAKPPATLVNEIPERRHFLVIRNY